MIENKYRKYIRKKIGNKMRNILIRIHSAWANIYNVNNNNKQSFLDFCVC